MVEYIEQKFREARVILNKGNPYFICDDSLILSSAYLNEIYSEIVIGIESHIFNNEDVGVVFEGDVIPSELITTDGMFNSLDLIELYSNSSTLRIVGADRISRSIYSIKNYIQSQFDKKIHINAYLTSGMSNGVGRHYDEHDVIIVQINGEKNWILDWNNENCSKEFTISSGKVFAIKKGIVHTTNTGRNASCHLTIGYNSFTTKKLIQLQKSEYEPTFAESKISQLDLLDSSRKIRLISDEIIFRKKVLQYLNYLGDATKLTSSLTDYFCMKSALENHTSIKYKDLAKFAIKAGVAEII